MIEILVIFTHQLIKVRDYINKLLRYTQIMYCPFLLGLISSLPVHVAEVLMIATLGLLSLPGTLKHFFLAASLEGLETVNKKRCITTLQFRIYW